MSDEHIINFPRAVIYEAVFGNHATPPKLSVVHKDGRTCIWFGGREPAIVLEGTAVDIEIEPMGVSPGRLVATRVRLVRVSP